MTKLPITTITGDKTTLGESLFNSDISFDGRVLKEVSSLFYNQCMTDKKHVSQFLEKHQNISNKEKRKTQHITHVGRTYTT